MPTADDLPFFLSDRSPSEIVCGTLLLGEHLSAGDFGASIRRECTRWTSSVLIPRSASAGLTCCGSRPRKPAERGARGDRSLHGKSAAARLSRDQALRRPRIEGGYDTF